MTRTRPAIAIALAALGLLVACDRENPDAPPDITYGVSVCAECDMIISDERYASALVFADSRGRPTPLLFDDIGDQVIYESSRPDLQILSRWVHDQATRAWLHAEAATFLRSHALRTPMASGLAAFGSRADAESMRATLGSGDVLTFAELWSASASSGVPSTTPPSQDQTP